MILFKDQLRMLRNYFSIRPIQISSISSQSGYSISDGFFWRANSNFKTIFSFSDLPKIFFDNDAFKTKILFYDNEFNYIKDLEFSDYSLQKKIIINNQSLMTKSEYGLFFIFHYSEENFDFSIRNSCYTGFAYNDSSYSFVHGNCPTMGLNNKDKKKQFNIVGKSIFVNQVYKIQDFFSEYDKVELMINNPLNSKIKVSINDNVCLFKPNETKLILITDNQVLLKSNCYFIRPIIFKYKNEFIDVHHA